MDLIHQIIANWEVFLTAFLAVVGAFAALLSALYALFLLIPGEQPDKAIKGLLDLTKKWSKKSVLPFLLSSSIALTACGTMNTSEKTECLKKAAASEIAVTEAYESVIAMYKADMIDKKTAQKAEKSIDAANAVTDSAGRMCQLDEVKANNYLVEAASLLIEANQILGDR